MEDIIIIDELTPATTATTAIEIEYTLENCKIDLLQCQSLNSTISQPPLTLLGDGDGSSSMDYIQISAVLVLGILIIMIIDFLRRHFSKL